MVTQWWSWNLNPDSFYLDVVLLFRLLSNWLNAHVMTNVGAANVKYKRV